MFVTPEQFREAREFTGRSRQSVADLLGVSLRTVGHWETGRSRVPYAPYKLLRVLLKGDIADAAWSGYRISRGRLVTPEGHAFAPSDLSWLSLLVNRAGFSSLRTVIAGATLRSGGRSGAVDTSAGVGALLVRARGCVSSPEPISPTGSVRLPSSNRGVSETERLATGVSPSGKRRGRGAQAPAPRRSLNISQSRPLVRLNGGAA